ncbi:membrane-binding protein [Algoriphagus aquimarinus]|uniref:toxin-antitoxin system YwqK family antitoxin n=1 Tax=Algoriphagus aquimarinus TaxID=237018 RepID=UPI0030DCDF9B|tara:strand:- start:9993 stop:10619 length:627 start_codon:yes stop_codon:yes gene_type:complete
MHQNFLTLLILGLCLIGCSEKKTLPIYSPPNPVETLSEIPDIVVDISELLYDTKTSIWTLNEQLFSGYAVSFYPDGTPKEKIGILKGRKQNQAITWYADGHYKDIATYHQGKLNGDKKNWSPDPAHILESHLHYVSGKPHGEQKKWYPSGEVFKILHLNMGKEEGLQQAFRENGALFANYEAREGRIFGLKKTALCYGLEDENIQIRK